MAERRMLARSIIDADLFLEMPHSSQCLYLHLAMRADDDGFVNNPIRILRLTGCGNDDMRLLCEKRFIIPFESGVCVVRHWKIHNYIQKDRYKPTLYTEEMRLLSCSETGEYRLDTECIQPVYKLDTQVREGKGRKVEDSKTSCSPDGERSADADKKTSDKKEQQTRLAALFAGFWTAYPRKEGKRTAEAAFNKIAPDDSLYALILDKLKEAKRCEQWTRDGGQYIPHAATWLNGRRYEDEGTIDAPRRRMTAGRPAVTAEDYSDSFFRNGAG